MALLRLFLLGNWFLKVEPKGLGYAAISEDIVAPGLPTGAVVVAPVDTSSSQLRKLFISLIFSYKQDIALKKLCAYSFPLVSLRNS